MLSHHITFKLRKIITLSSTLELILNEVAFPFASECLFLCLRLQVFFFFSFVSVLIFFSTFFFFLVGCICFFLKEGWLSESTISKLSVSLLFFNQRHFSKHCSECCQVC